MKETNISTPLVDKYIVKAKKTLIANSKESKLGERFDNYYFRGENKVYSRTTTSLYRILSSKEKQNPVAFKRKVVMLEDAINKLSPTKERFFPTMVKLRHMGICTPLIDISRSFFVALFFACIPKEESDGNLWEDLEEKNGCLKIFKRNSFTVIDEFTFKDMYYEKFFLTGLSDPNIVIQGDDWMHPNIKKQEAVVCMPSNGVIEDFIKISINREEKKGIIEELKALGYSSETLFANKEGILTDLLIDREYMDGVDIIEGSVAPPYISPPISNNELQNALNWEIHSENEFSKGVYKFANVLNNYSEDVYRITSEGILKTTIKRKLLFSYFYSAYSLEKRGWSNLFTSLLKILEWEILSIEKKKELENFYAHYVSEIYKKSYEKGYFVLLHSLFNPKRLLSIDTNLVCCSLQLRSLLNIKSEYCKNEVTGVFVDILLKWWNFVYEEVENIIYDYRKMDTLMRYNAHGNITFGFKDGDRKNHRIFLTHIELILWTISFVCGSKNYSSLGKTNPLDYLMIKIKELNYPKNIVSSVNAKLSKLIEEELFQFVFKEKTRDTCSTIKWFIDQMRAPLLEKVKN